MAKQTKTLDYLQALRGIAALMVVLYHGSRFISPYGEGLGWRLFGAGGALGVDLFFVISGFIMVFTTGDPKASAAEFAIKRFSRIWPVYVLISLLYIFLTFGLNYLYDPEKIQRLLSTVLLIPMGATDGVSIYHPGLAVGWSLNFEAYFYLLFGLSLVFGRWRWAAFFGWIGLTLLGAPILAGQPISLTPHPGYGFTNGPLALATSPLIWLFVAGVVIGLIHQSRLILPPFWSGLLAAVAVTMYAFQYASGLLNWHGITQGGLFASLLVLTLAVAGKNVTIPTPKLLVLLGNISFSLYLVHPFAQEQMEALFVARGWGGYATGFPFLFLTTTISILLATVSFRLLERGLSEWIRCQLQRLLNKSAGYAAPPR